MTDFPSPINNDLKEDISDFWASHGIIYLDNPSPLQFLRDAVTAYQPVIIRNVIDHWPALQKWNIDYFEKYCADKIVEVNVTPDGLGDAVKTCADGIRRFHYPAEHMIKLESFCTMMKNRNAEDAVLYLSQQDNNFVKKFPELSGDIGGSLPLVDEIFGSTPEATNIWIGDERSTSSLHKDFFENMYAVISGEKSFTLIPPASIAFMKEEYFPTVRYALNATGVDGRPLSSNIVSSSEGCPSSSLTWIDVDIDYGIPLERNPKWNHIHKVHCVVKPGEILYIPALWYHQVSQTQLTIAINFWYEMKFDFRFIFYQLAQRTGINGNSKAVVENEDDEIVQENVQFL